MSTNYPSRIGPVSELPRGQPAVPADSDPGPSSCGVDQLSRAIRPGFELTRDRTAILANSVPDLSAAGWTSCPCRLRHGSE